MSVVVDPDKPCPECRYIKYLLEKSKRADLITMMAWWTAHTQMFHMNKAMFDWHMILNKARPWLAEKPISSSVTASSDRQIGKPTLNRKRRNRQKSKRT